MAKIEVLLPQMGEGVIEATVTRWLIDLNNSVVEDEPLVEIATDKVDSEVPSPASGRLVKQFFAEGEIPKVGDVIAVIHTEGDDEEANVEEVTSGEAISVKNEEYHVAETEEFVVKIPSDEKSLITPFIRHYAGQRGISYEDLQNVVGTGSNREITKNDVLNFFKSEKVVTGIHRNQETIIPVAQKPYHQTVKNQEAEQAVYVPKEGEEVVEIDRTRKLIAEYMVKSVQTAPHVTSTVEIDISHIVQWREEIKVSFKAENNANLTYTPIIVQQVAKALKDFPGINVSLMGSQLIRKKFINIGIATALPNGNLIVPVLRNADHKNLTSLALEIAGQTARARANQLKPGETAGGTFTITNLGQFNNVMGTPIINQPESAILAVGAIKKKPWVVEEKGSQTIGIRDILTLSLSYDHRIIDGALGGAFLNRIGQLLEQLSPSL